MVHKASISYLYGVAEVTRWRSSLRAHVHDLRRSHGPVQLNCVSHTGATDSPKNAVKDSVNIQEGCGVLLYDFKVRNMRCEGQLASAANTMDHRVCI